MTSEVDGGRHARLRKFILLDMGVTITAALAIVVFNALTVRHAWLWVATGLVVAAAATMAMGLRSLAHGSVSGAVWWLAAANWGISVTAAAIATFAVPITQMAALLPVVVAASYVSARQVRVVLAVSFAVSVAAAVVGLTQDFSGVTDAVPSWLPPTMLIMFLPFMSVLFAQAGAAAAATLRDALDDSLDANAELRASQDALAEQATLLRASRQRVVAAADEERRRVERDLHDGAQQRLVGVSLKVTEARGSVRGDPEQTERLLDDVRRELRLAQEEMRSLVRGLYPPVLLQHGLPAALRSVLVQVPNPFRERIEAIGRLEPDLEAALYFCALESLQNVQRHVGPDAVVSVSLDRDAERVRLEVSDDGPGFDVGRPRDGAGLDNMTDRLGAAGGSVAIVSRPGGPTTIAATVPLDSAP